MKNRVLFFAWFAFLIVLSVSSYAQERPFRIEALQVTAIEPYENSYNEFLDEMAQGGVVLGKNLEINRVIIDFDVETAGLWKKVMVLMRIKREASRIVKARPDLVLTIGTPATKYAKDKIIDAGIPVVFTAVAIPTAAGCK